jgi:hypothetical protein
MLTHFLSIQSTIMLAKATTPMSNQVSSIDPAWAAGTRRTGGITIKKNASVKSRKELARSQ